MYHVELLARDLWLPISKHSFQGDAVWQAIVKRKMLTVNTRVIRSDGRVILWPKGQAPKGYEYTVK